MANEQQLELSRLALERSRLELERRRLMLDERRPDIDPIIADAERSREMASQFAKAALQNLFLLNGGALIAFPAFGQLVGTAFKEQVGWVLASLGGFVSGLLFVMLATLMAYLALEAATRYAYCYSVVKQYEHLKSQFPDHYDDASDAARIEAERQSDSSLSRFGYFKWAAVSLGVASLIAFIVGALFAARVLSP